jgi:hypothetical protein
MPAQAQAATCRYLAARGGAALGRFGGGVAGGFLGPGAAAAGSQVGSWLGGAGGAALGAAWCPDGDPRGGDWPLTPDTSAQCPVPYNWVWQYNVIRPPEFGDEIRTAQATSTGPFGPETRSTGPGGSIVLSRSTAGGAECAVSTTNAIESNLTTISFTATRTDGLADDCGAGIRPTLPGVGPDIPPINDDPLARNPINIDIDFGNNVIIPISGELRLTGPVLSNNRLALGFNFDGLDFILFPNGTINIGGGSDYPEIGDPPPDPEETTNYEFAGVAYTVTNAANNQSYDQVEQGRFYYPRFGSISFKGKGLRSEQFPMHGQTGYILNPEPSLFSSFNFTPYRATNTADFLKVGKSNCCKVVSYTVSQ